MNYAHVLLAACAMVFAAAAAPAQPITALVNARIVTVDLRQPLAEAVLLRGTVIEAVGREAEIRAMLPAGAEVIDCRGRMVLPGLIDGHAHLAGLGNALSVLSVTGVRSEAEVARIVRERARTVKPGEWITGGRWDQNIWASKVFPSYQSLTEAAPDNPVYLTRVDGHAGWANKKAMDIAGISAGTKDPDGGKIIRLEGSGEPTGVFIDRAQSLIRACIPEPSGAELERQLRLAVDACLKTGLTGVHDAGISVPAVERYKRLIDAGEFPFRVYAMITVPSDLKGQAIDEFLQQHRVIGYGGNRLSVRSIKQMGDGALGSRGAAMIEPYTDDPGNRGLLITGRARTEEVASAALRTGFQVNTHAIGDLANKEALDGYEAALRQYPRADHRFRIEHAQVVRLADFPRYALLGVLPSMQPTHATSDMFWAEDRVGPARVLGAYSWRMFYEAGLPVIGGSDFPVESHNPLLGFYAAITRQNAEGKPEGGWRPDQRMTRMEALRSMTIDAAYGAFEEDLKGSITPGKLADLVILDRDIMTIPPRDILDTRVLLTMLGGEVVYRSNEW